MEQNQELIRLFLAWVAMSKSKETVRSYGFALMQFEHWLEAHQKILVECSINDISEYIASLRERGLKAGTISVYAASLKSLWKWLHSQGIVKWDERLIPHISADDVTSYAVAQPRDVKRLVASYRDYFPDELRDKAAISLLWDTGVRVSELLSLNVHDLDLVGKKAVTRTYKRKKHFREIYWEEETNMYLKRWLTVRESVIGRAGQGCEAVFISLSSNNRGDRIGRHTLQLSMRNRCKELGIVPGITPHGLRHGFATMRHRLGMDIRHIQELLGHAKITTTQIYTRVGKKDLEDAYRRMYAKSHDYAETESNWDSQSPPTQAGLQSYG